MRQIVSRRATRAKIFAEAGKKTSTWVAEGGVRLIEVGVLELNRYPDNDSARRAARASAA